ncbi:hypothetical protein SAMN04488055_5417 [Chitinophaga niabensis]|uniref:Uncharacterized protein n=1 Tax=Chitinophaga niabensis TaxID=536979 RepID=A0A1N6KA20_9BACT|nr:hypothetical protein SAMN04488055_5417 [Chitinophaga niabensis]
MFLNGNNIFLLGKLLLQWIMVIPGVRMSDFLAEIFGGLTLKFLYLQPLKGIKQALKAR